MHVSQAGSKGRRSQEGVIVLRGRGVVVRDSWLGFLQSSREGNSSGWDENPHSSVQNRAA